MILCGPMYASPAYVLTIQRLVMVNIAAGVSLPAFDDIEQVCIGKMFLLVGHHDKTTIGCFELFGVEFMAQLAQASIQTMRPECLPSTNFVSAQPTDWGVIIS